METLKAQNLLNLIPTETLNKLMPYKGRIGEVLAGVSDFAHLKYHILDEVSLFRYCDRYSCEMGDEARLAYIRDNYESLILYLEYDFSKVTSLRLGFGLNLSVRYHPFISISSNTSNRTIPTNYSLGTGFLKDVFDTLTVPKNYLLSTMSFKWAKF
jgi:hypothetical protein